MSYCSQVLSPAATVLSPAATVLSLPTAKWHWRPAPAHLSKSPGWILQVTRSEKMIHQHYSVLTIYIYIYNTYICVYIYIYVFNSIPFRYLHIISHNYIHIDMGFCGIMHTIILSFCNYSQIQIKVSPPPQSYELTTRMDGPNRPIGCLKPWRVPATGTQWWFAQHVNVCPHRSMTTEVTT